MFRNYRSGYLMFLKLAHLPRIEEAEFWGQIFCLQNIFPWGNYQPIVPLETDNVRRQIFKRNFKPNEGYFILTIINYQAWFNIAQVPSTLELDRARLNGERKKAQTSNFKCQDHHWVYYNNKKKTFAKTEISINTNYILICWSSYFIWTYLKFHVHMYLCMKAAYLTAFCTIKKTSSTMLDVTASSSPPSVTSIFTAWQKKTQKQCYNVSH